MSSTFSAASDVLDGECTPEKVAVESGMLSFLVLSSFVLGFVHACLFRYKTRNLSAEYETGLGKT